MKNTRFKKGMVPWNKGKKGVQPSTRRGIKQSADFCEKIRNGKKKHPGRGFKGKKHRPETIEKIRANKLANTPRGEKSHRWIADRSKLAKRQERNDMAYKDWRHQVKMRDSFTCKIADGNCAGRLEVHHILGWTEHPELRYAVNNGITLCHAHHPRRREEEAKLSPYFQSLVAKLN